MGVLKAKVAGAWVPIGQGFTASAPGLVGSAKLTATQTINTAGAATDLTGCTVTWTADPTHSYKVSIVGTVQKITNAGDLVLGIRSGGNVSMGECVATLPVNAYTTLTVTIVETGLSGTQTRKGFGYLPTVGGTYVANSTNPFTIIVEDITTNIPPNRVLPATSLVKNATQSMAAGWVQCSFPGTPEYDTDGMKTGNGYLTIKRAGYWDVSYSVVFSAIATAGRVVPAIVRNGDTNGNRFASSSISVAPNDDGSISGSQLIKCNVNDWLEVWVFNANPRDFGNAAVPSRFTAAYLGSF